MVTYYPSHVNLNHRFSSISGQHTGITESRVLTTTFTRNGAGMEVCTASMPAYHKLIINEKADISYHLSGYGIYFEEAYVRLLGEAVERYALLYAPWLYRSKVRYASYEKLSSETNCMKWEHMKIFSDEDYKKIEKDTSIRNFTKNDIIGWVKCPKLFEPNESIYIPTQVLFTGYTPNKEMNEAFFTPALSKGTAAHVDKRKALVAAMMESVEAHCFMVHWYTDYPTKEIIIDDINLQNAIDKILQNTNITATFYDLSLSDMPGCTIGAVLTNKENKRPLLVMGCQSGLDPAKVVYRSLAEALAIYYLAYNGPLMLPHQYLKTKKKQVFNNLDTNVAYYAFPDNCEEKLKIVQGMVSGQMLFSSIKNNSGNSQMELEYVVNSLKKVSKDAVCLDVTPQEVKQKGFIVLRTFFPELVQLSLPSYPFTQHPALLQYGGVTNEHPHPLP